jgi:hypothetical protein
MKNTLFSAIFTLLCALGFSTDYTAINSGPFDNVNTWDVNGIPPTDMSTTTIMDGDRVIINAGVMVDINIFIINNGEFINKGTINLTSTFINVKIFQMELAVLLILIT